MATIKIRCTKCGEHFQFLGMGTGFDLNGVAASDDRHELRVAVGTPETIAEYYRAVTGIRMAVTTEEDQKNLTVTAGKIEPFPEPIPFPNDGTRKASSR